MFSPYNNIQAIISDMQGSGGATEKRVEGISYIIGDFYQKNTI